MKTLKTLFEKLDHQAEKLIQEMDRQLQQPVTQAITGEVFRHGTTPNPDKDKQASLSTLEQSEEQATDTAIKLNTLACSNAEI